MNRYYKYFFLLFVFFYTGYTTAQVRSLSDSNINTWKEYFDLSYGPDYNLINGIEYLYLYSNVTGHPFFGENRFYTGRLVIDDQEFQDVDIKYDIYNQNIILRYLLVSGGLNQIILNNEFIQEFNIDGRFFRKYFFPETGTRFFQVVASGKINCLYYWEKNLDQSSSSAWNPYSFALQKKQAYIVINNKIYPFKNRRSFVRLFPAQYQKEIKQFIRKNRIWLKRASDNGMRRLIEFCNQLTENK
jgi:hypothetical protein